LVTGGAGFIGCAISPKLASLFDRVIAIDNLHPQIHPRPVRPSRLHEKVELFIGDVTLSETWDEVLADVKPETVIHLAAETGTGQSLTEATRHANVNVVGTTRMLDAMIRNHLPSQIILTSSRAVYGEGAWQSLETGEISYPGQRSKAQLEKGEWDFKGLKCLPFDALATEPRPTSIYGVTKLTQEYVLRAWTGAVDVDLCILRLQNVYGPGQSPANPYTGIVSLFATLARANKTIPIYEDGQIVRDFVYIDDVADAITRLIRNRKASGSVYDVGSGAPTSIAELGSLIASIYGAPPPQITGQFRNGDIRHAACDITRTKRVLDWSPRWDIEAGVKELCRWIDGL
jgi:dTDP-L-rhamnose 4-epimerase